MRLTQRKAMELFQARGFDDVTVGEIAAEVGMAASTLYRHFATKESIVLWDEHESAIEDALERERQVILDSEEVQKKPEEFREKIVEGKLKRYYSERCLSEQAWIHDDKTSVGKQLEKELGAGTRIETFGRVRLG